MDVDANGGSVACDPIAVIGMDCRFAPDTTLPDSLWSFLQAHAD